MVGFLGEFRHKFCTQKEDPGIYIYIIDFGNSVLVKKYSKFFLTSPVIFTKEPVKFRQLFLVTLISLAWLFIPTSHVGFESLIFKVWNFPLLN